MSLLFILALFNHVYLGYETFKILHEQVDPRNAETCLKTWIVYAALTSAERFADVLLFWLPFYYPAKVLVYLAASPLTDTCQKLFDCQIAPFLAQHEAKYDQLVQQFNFFKCRQCLEYVLELVVALGRLLSVQMPFILGSLKKKTDCAVVEWRRPVRTPKPVAFAKRRSRTQIDQ